MSVSHILKPAAKPPSHYTSTTTSAFINHLHSAFSFLILLFFQYLSSRSPRSYGVSFLCSPAIPGSRHHGHRNGVILVFICVESR